MDEEQGKPKTIESFLFSLTIKNINYYKPSGNLKVIEIFGSVFNYSSIALTLVLLVVYPPGALSLIQLNQAIYMLQLLKVDLPANLIALASQFSKHGLLLAPNPMSTQNSVSACKPDIAFYRLENFSCGILESRVPTLVVQLLILWVLKMVLNRFAVFLVKKNFKEKVRRRELMDDKMTPKGKDNKLLDWVVKLNLVVSKRLILYYFLMTQYDFFTDSFIALKYPGSRENNNRIINQSGALIILLIYFLLVIWFTCIYCKKSKEKIEEAQETKKEKNKKKEDFDRKSYCYGEFVDKSTTPPVTHITSLILNGALCLVLVIGPEPDFQLYLTLGILLVHVGFNIANNPYSSSIQSGLTLTRHIFLALVPGALAIQTLVNLSKKVLYNVIGTTLVILLSLILTAELICQIIAIIITVKNSKKSIKKQKIEKLTSILKYLKLLNEEEETDIPMEGPEKGLTLDSRMSRMQSTMFNKRISTNLGGRSQKSFQTAKGLSMATSTPPSKFKEASTPDLKL